MAALSEYREPLLRAGNEDAEDAVVEVMNIVSGWPNPWAIEPSTTKTPADFTHDAVCRVRPTFTASCVITFHVVRCAIYG